jgi:hypothetical protein
MNRESPVCKSEALPIEALKVEEEEEEFQPMFVY